jgi:hypothetical protein
MYRIPDLTEIAAGAIAYLTLIIPWFECAQYSQVAW